MTDQPSAPPPPPAAGAKQQNTVMLVLAYLWILALVPLLVEKEDKEVQWHAKHGLVILAAEIVIGIAMAIITSLPVLGVVGCAIYPLLWIVDLVLRVMCIVKATKGERLIIPGVSQYADKF
jgi:uncharacterized membrane protein